jgi:hypothetical protein
VKLRCIPDTEALFSGMYSSMRFPFAESPIYKHSGPLVEVELVAIVDVGVE